MERVANSRTVIIENIALDLGLTSKELQRFLLDSLESLGVKDMQIVDIDVETGGANNSVAVEVADQNMVDKMRKLDGVTCLGEKMKVRRVGEETTQTNAQAAVIALTALSMITGGQKSKSTASKT